MKKKVSDKQRRLGEFFTPTIWVDEAHKMISENLGADWKEKYIVWDPAWGTGNLTRDYKFKELYCSTIEASDIHTANQMGYNPEAVKFQYDFLNDGIFPNPETGELEINIDLDTKMPQGLKDAIKQGKPIVVLMNPPYATAANIGETHKKNATKNNINNFMINNNWGKASQNLYAQFLCRITEYQKKNKNIKIGIFCPSLFLTGGSFDSFRSKFLNQFNFKNGFLFKASHFSDVSSDWGISFILFDCGKNKNLFNLEVVDFNSFFELTKQSSKQLYNTDNHTPASKWVREEVKGLKTNSGLPQLQNATNINIKNQARGAYVNDALGYFYSGGNNIDKNAVNVGMWSAGFYNGKGLSIIKQNFLKCTSLFTARKCIMPNWINSKDEYLAPNENHPLWQQFQYDSIVYSLFHIHSYQSSLRQVEYKDKLWDIKNEFFWLSKEKMKQLAEENDFDALYQDVRTSDERYVYELLFGEQNIYNKLSPDAKSILDKATELMEKSISMRKMMSEEHPEYHLQSWDAGYAQMKLVWKQYFKNEFDEFRNMFKAFSNRMLPLVYEVGFLLNN